MGYEVKRFVDNVNQEFICGLCNGVMKEPVVVKDCQHFFCTECIQNRMTFSANCPNDSNLLSFSTLIEPQKPILNLLNQLRIKCQFEDKGCEEVLALGQLDKHQRNCKLNPINGLQIKCFCGKQVIRKDFGQHKEDCLPFVRKQLNINRSQISTFMADIHTKSAQTVSEKCFKSETEYFYHRLSRALPQKSRNQNSIDNILLYLNWRLLDYKSGPKANYKIQLALRDLIRATHENREAFKVFNRLNGLDYILLTISLTQNRDINQSISQFFVNFTHFETQLRKLMDKQYLNLLKTFLNTKTNGFETSFNCVDILSAMIVTFNENWNHFSTNKVREELLKGLKTTLTEWKLNVKLKKYKTFDPLIDRLNEKLDSMPPEVQFRYVWIFVHHIRDEPKKYVPMIESKNTIELLQSLLQNDKTEAYVKDFLQLLFHQINTFKSLGHLNGLENSDKRVIESTKC